MNRNARTALVGVGIIAAMVGLTAASVPLYDWFCRVTGYGGTTQRAGGAPVEVLDRTITVRFNADVDPKLGWRFAPVERTVDVKIGENRLAFYSAENVGERPLVGTATFNVTPYDAGPYFSKIHCFCFEEQPLMPGETVEMPVSFYVDPAILDDPDTAELETITLSYTFFLAERATDELAAETAAGDAAES
jgi:cytochrome c oxidase assembly protein subunit 11